MTPLCTKSSVPTVAAAKDSEIQALKAKLDAGEVAIVIGGQEHFQGVILLSRSVAFPSRGFINGF